MPVNIGQLDTCLMLPLQTHSITLQPHYENLQGTPTVLPTTEPGTSQIIYTVASGDLPIVPAPLLCKYAGTMYASGKNTDGANPYTLSYRIIKNGTSLYTSTLSVPANAYWNLSACRWPNLVVGDIMEIRLWANNAALTWDYQARHIQPTRIRPAENTRLITNLALSFTSLPVLSAIPSVGSNYGFLYNAADTANLSTISLTATQTFKAAAPGPTYGIGQLNSDNANSQYTNTNASRSSVTYARNYVPTTISFRLTPIQL